MTSKKANLCLYLFPFVFNVYENKSSVGSAEAIWAYYPVSKKRSTGIAVEENTPGAYPKGTPPPPPPQTNAQSTGDICNKEQSEETLFLLFIRLCAENWTSADHLFCSSLYPALLAWL